MRYLSTKIQASSILAVAVLAIAAPLFIPDAIFLYLPFHSMLEASGAMVALILSFLMIHAPGLDRQKVPASEQIWIPCALTGMGALDLFHSVVGPGDSFVWLHSTAVFVGGFLFACVWIPEKAVKPKTLSLLPGFILFSAVFVSAYSIVWPERIPPMLDNVGNFTITAKRLNVFGGFLFLIASVWFFTRLKTGRREDSFLLGSLCVLFGLAGAIFDYSALWNVEWWIWHALRFLAYLFVLYFLFSSYQRTNEALAESEERFRSAFEQAAVGMAHVSPDGAWLRVNQRLCDMLKYTCDELLGLSFQEVTYPDDLNDSAEILKRFIAGEIESHDTEKRYVSKDGGIIWAHLTVSLVRDHLGSPKYFISIIEDISERKRIQQELQRKDQQISLLLNSTAEAIYGLDLNGNCTFCNKACVEMLGYASSAEVLGRNMHDLIHHTKADGTKYAEKECKIYKAFRQGEGTHVDDEVLWRADGTNFCAEYWSYPMFEDDEIVGSVVTFVNITERVNAKRQVIHSLREKEVLLREIHHRVKNNMQIISTLLELQASHLSDDKLERAFEESRTRVKAMALLHEVLYQSKDIARIDLDAYMNKLVKHLETIYATQYGRVSLEIQTDKSTLEMDDAIPCGLILNELIANCYKYAFPGDRHGLISVLIQRKSKDVLEMTVQDDGVGLPDDLDLENPTTLGLSLVSGLVKTQLGGTMAVDKGAGTRISISFKPRYTEREAA